MAARATSTPTTIISVARAGERPVAADREAVLERRDVAVRPGRTGPLAASGAIPAMSRRDGAVAPDSPGASLPARPPAPCPAAAGAGGRRGGAGARGAAPAAAATVAGAVAGAGEWVSSAADGSTSEPGGAVIGR